MRLAPLVSVAFLVMTLGAGCVQGSTTDLTTSKDEPTGISDAVVKVKPMKTYTPAGKLPANELEKKQVRITTEKGDIVLELYPDTAPLAVSNFISLAKQGYYDGLIFHRVIKGFMIQGGDPTGTGSGGPGYQFADELKDGRAYARGTLAMANAGPNTNGSQFFIMHKNVPLDHLYTIFGKVISGLEFVDAIAETSVDGQDRPRAEQKMVKVSVEDVK